MTEQVAMSHTRRRFLASTAGLAAATAAGAEASGAVAPASAAPVQGRGPDAAISIVSLDEVQRQAKSVLSPAAYTFVADGAGDQWTLGENRRAFNDFPILTHRLRGVQTAAIATETQLLGHTMPSPLIVLPMGLHLMVHKDAEAATAAGAGRAGVLYTASGASNLPLEHIAKATSGPKWFQVYFNADAGITHDILLRARDAGYSAIVLTADAIGPGTSDAFVAMGNPFPAGMTFGNNDPRYGGRGSFLAQNTALKMDDIGMIRQLTGLPVVVKGIMRPVDATDAVTAGAAAIQVSNHGGRQIDGVPASIAMLQDVVEAVQGRVPVIFDGGIRRGIDVFRALALGATAVGVGRPVLFGAALGGPGGVQSVLDHLTLELHQAMLLGGVQTTQDIGRDNLVVRAPLRKET